MPTLYDRLSPTDQKRREKLLVDLGNYSSLYYGESAGGMFEDELWKRDKDAWRRRHDLIWAEAEHIMGELLALTTQQERIELRGEFSRTDVAQLVKAADPDFSKWTQEEREECAKQAQAENYGFANSTERFQQERSSKFLSMLDTANKELTSRELEKVITFLKAKNVGTPYLYRQLRDGKHR